MALGPKWLKLLLSLPVDSSALLEALLNSDSEPPHIIIYIYISISIDIDIDIGRGRVSSSPLEFELS